ncbi:MULTISPECIES: antibiotic biosynthesis monooxygenase [Pseudomonas]|uniref:Membrane protein n=1 Tax=Pseudomonas chlororaphis subsp. aureofaciens TaxID=587851 RepID=A0AAD0ZQL6_9PSED|nr:MULTISPECIES: antibiotic biosynthesis monooxygenase [Pseudomonas]AZD93319.1 putative membrane protein [Pseudomonas chlororaphis subsp. aureofaciens]AZE30496.1 putative membrane protein [Pseudomonas chlororaphis subsp. aureofaciens]AZE43129.1 putative membrane protein [Pseudomonas chlororaphis subsp. aureofaciens]KAB0533352.1 antibiotic biosynthesis monooxygenase [Pseudomonas chlororaphis subsp. aureofaciens]TSD27066.1 antibiotic biosynthesis monooxygenase [Pseudomonas sp. ATCC 13985]
MSDSNRLEASARPDSDEVVTLIVKHRVKAGLEAPYEAWLRRIVGVAGQYEGHLGVDVIRGKSGGLDLFTCVLRFCSTEAMQRWLDSPQRRALVDEAAPMLADGDQTEVHPVHEFWFSTQADTASPPPRWKQALLTMLVILPHTLLVPLIWGPVLQLNAWLGNYVVATFLITLTIVLSVVYLFMPLATRLFAPWLQATVTDRHLEPGHGQ